MDLGYKCYNCIELEKQEEKDAQWEKERKLNERIIKDGVKICPKSNGKLVVRKSQMDISMVVRIILIVFIVKI